MASNRKEKARKEKTGFSYYELFNSASSSRSGINKFVNDGSFLEKFKKTVQEPTSQTEDNLASNAADPSNGKSPISVTKDNDSSTDHQIIVETAKPEAAINEQQKKATPLPFIGKRRGGKVLPTGMVKKVRKEEDEEIGENRTDAWSHYMKEVKRYQQQSCEDEGKTRPLVK